MNPKIIEKGIHDRSYGTAQRLLMQPPRCRREMVPGLHTSQGELKKFIAWNTHKKAIIRHHISPKQIFQPPWTFKREEPPHHKRANGGERPTLERCRGRKNFFRQTTLTTYILHTPKKHIDVKEIDQDTPQQSYTHAQTRPYAA